ncbi:hypothetical protein GUITHDRAFT_135481 [Guillardia theta CCMP2712]|uniref:Uncharacterized protein n=4 Tax=Guillardia theta TaxID=55529 RepID=L1JP35_GUITC|nr:hypothetical protein GUITHDRAFT_135481 [Guillardia theta CCMP2712]EKX50336.1 hypothetical protein GUITHDRAFT_135481 [Guillardia theta CCMP2712]|eukprot:XP_005837316.1 hypothetical protein GUITHDRAFT_135481 [Guillardia theta CCMP2712]
MSRGDVMEEAAIKARIGLQGLGDSAERVWLKAGTKLGRGVSKSLRDSLQEPQKDKLKFEFRAIKGFDVPAVPPCIHQVDGLVSFQVAEIRTRHGRRDFDSSIFHTVLERIHMETQRGFSRIGSLSLDFFSCPPDVQLPLVAELLHSSPSIAELSLVNVPLGNSGMKLLAAGCEGGGVLRSLTLHSIGVDEGGASSLGRIIYLNSSLTVLSLNDLALSFNGGKMVGEALMSNSTLMSLSLRNARLGPLGMGIFSPCLANKVSLQKLDLHGNDIQNFGLMQVLSAMSELRSIRCLDLSCNCIDGYFIMNLTGLVDHRNGLESLKIGGMHRMEIYLPALLNLPMITHLKELDLSETARGSEFLTLFAVGLASLKHLVWLGLSSLSLKAEEILVLSRSLSSLESLEHLNFSRNFIGQQGMIALANTNFARMSRLTALDLALNDLGPVGSICLCSCLDTFSNLTSLDLSHNQLGAVGGQQLISAIPRHLKGLKSLGMAGNMLGDRGGEHLVEEVLVNRQVEYVNLSGNGLSEECVEYIREICDSLEICIEINQ